MAIDNKLININVITTPVPFRDNCSFFDPCGRYGYCRHNKNDEWTCVCKFWWVGKLCNELSDGGKQIIALGVIVGILIIVFYGLSLYHFIRKKRKLPKSEPNGILTLIVATCTLIAKWIILKPIHEDIVDKFNNNQSLFFKQHSVCRVIDLTAEFNIFTFPFACLLMILFIIITKRVAFLQRRFCHGYFGIPIPLDFFAHVKRTLAAVIFAVFADELLDIAQQALGGNGPSTNRGIIVTYIFQIIKVFVIGFRRYPILAAVYIDNYFSLICATLYIWLDFSISILYTGLCRNDFYPTDLNFNETQGSRVDTYLTYYGTGSTLLFFQLFTDIPRYVCLSYISVKLPILLFKRIRQRKQIDKQFTREQKNLLHSSLPQSAESRYVKKLLGTNNTEIPTNRFMKIVRAIYSWRDDFRFSSRIVCVYASLLLLLFFVTVQFCVQGPPILDSVRESVQKVVNLFSSLASEDDTELQKPEDPSADFPLPNFIRPYFFAVIIALVITVAQLLIMLAGIRRNTLQAFRGDNSEIPRRLPSQNVSYITGNFHFAGYLIGYVILSYILVAIIALLLAVAIDAFITYGSVKALESFLKLLIPPILFVTFKVCLNKFLGQYAFLQHRGEVLSINNRRAYMVFIYFNFFLDAFLGLFAAFMRILKSIFGGIIYMCRLDYSPLGRKLERMDAGFNSYCGYIHMECAHRHPVLLCFASHLLRDHLYPEATNRLSKAKHKWHLAMFLLNNPTLIYRRKGFLTRLQVGEIRTMLYGSKNINEIYIEQPPILAHRGSIISAKGLEELWDKRKF